MPSYNRQATLLSAAKSVLNQTYKDLELIIVDDGSTDQTRQALAAIADERLIYVPLNQNKGACAARNIGILKARGEYIAFQDSDDIWRPQKLAHQVALMARTGSDAVFCAFMRHEGGQDKDGERFPPLTAPEGIISFDDLLFENLVSTQTVLAKRECFRAIQFDESFPRLQDWEMALRLCRQYKVYYDPQVEVDVYLQGDSLSRDAQKGLVAYGRLFDMYYNELKGHPKAYMQFAVSMGQCLIACGQSPAGRYIRMIRPGLGLKNNLRLIKWAFRDGCVKR